MEKISAAALEPEAVDIPTFCLLHSISRASLYNLWRNGHGPTVMRIGSRVLISRESAALWRREMETITQQPGRGAEAGEG
jgi:hypothetical protein